MNLPKIFLLVFYRYGGRYTVTMMPGDGIGPEMSGHVREIFRKVGAPIDFEIVHLDPKTDNYDDLTNVSNHFIYSGLKFTKDR